MDHAKQIDDMAEALASTESELRDARGALARLEAERDTARQQVLDVVERSSDDIAHLRQQLAKAVKLLLDASDPKGPCIRYAAIKDFLLRYAAMPDMTAEQSAAISRRTREAYVAHAEQQEAQGAQAGEFQREDRYIVIKRKDLEAIERSGEAIDLETHEAVRFLAEALDTLRPHLPERQYLVIESDWPEYEPTWAAIQARVTGQGAQAGDERTAFRKEYDAFRQWAGSRLTARQLDLDEVGLFYDEVAGFGHDAWQARAALATQPAVPVYLPEANVWDAPSMSADTEPEIAWRDGFNYARDRVMNAVRGAEHE